MLAFPDEGEPLNQGCLRRGVEDQLVSVNGISRIRQREGRREPDRVGWMGESTGQKAGVAIDDHSRSSMMIRARLVRTGSPGLGMSSSN